MRVGINTLVAIPNEIGGIQTYLRGLLGGLAEIDRETEYVLFVAPWNREVFTPPAPNFRQVVCPVPLRPLPARVAYEQAALPAIALQERLDVFHAPANVMPLLTPCPTVVTIHDVLAFTYPEFVPATFRHYWRVMLRLTATRAARVLTDSQASSDDIVRFLRCPPEKVGVIYPAPGLFGGADQPEAQAASLARVRALQPYLLWVGKMYRHKNLPALLEAYALLRRDSPTTPGLVLTGMDGWGAGDALEHIRALGLSDHVTVTGRVSDAELEALYHGAEVFVFPSLYEGFGLPVVEAMRCGVPVVTSDRGALAEVAGEAALLVRPDSPAEIARGLRAVLYDSQLRARLIAAGRQRGTLFSWTAASQATLTSYRMVARRG